LLSRNKEVRLTHLVEVEEFSVAVFEIVLKEAFIAIAVGCGNRYNTVASLIELK
jgi:hypothetical protein